MELSKQKQTEAKKLNVTVQYLVMADLMAVGYSENDAYNIAYPENEALSVQQNNSIRNNILDSAKFKKLFESRRSRVKDGVAAPVQLEEVELVSTEEVMKEILRSAKQQPVGSKERADLFAKYNEIKAKNEQGTEDETDTINFVFPFGNGFDIKHNIPSKYSDFAKFVMEHNFPLFEQIEQCLRNLSLNGLWSNFEAALGTQDYDELLKYVKRNQISNRDYSIGIDYQELSLMFKEWINSLKIYMYRSYPKIRF